MQGGTAGYGGYGGFSAGWRVQAGICLHVREVMGVNPPYPPLGIRWMMIENQIEEDGFMNFQTVEERLVEAMAVLWRSGDRERAWLRGSTLPIWREVVAEHRDASPDDAAIVTCALTRAEVMRADEAMGWVAAWVASGDTRRVVGLVLSYLAAGNPRVDWPTIWERAGGKRGGWTTEGLRKRYGRAINGICSKLNANSSGGYSVSTSEIDRP